MNFSWSNWLRIFDQWPAFLYAFGQTLWISFLSLILTLIIGLIVGMILCGRGKVLPPLCKAYISLFQSTPLMIQVFIYYYVLPKMDCRLSGACIGVMGLALLNTIYIAAGAIVLSLFFGTLLGLLRHSKNRLLSSLAAVYIEIVRNIPLTLFIMMVRFMTPLEPVLSGIAAMSLFTSAIMAEIVRAVSTALRRASGKPPSRRASALWARCGISSSRRPSAKSAAR